MTPRLGHRALWAGTALAAMLWAAPLAWSEPPANAAPEDEDLAKDPVYTSIVAKLNSMKVSLDFSDAELRDVIDFVQQLSQINFVIDKRVESELKPEDLKITIQVKEVPLRTALKLVLNLRGLTAEYKDGVLVILPKHVLEEETYLRMYDVRDLMVKIHDFPGPEITLKSGEDQGVNAAFNETGPKATEDPEFIVKIIKENCGKDTWERIEGVSISFTAGGILLVNQSREVHKEIAKLINLLRMYK